jgi:hypothetical protein
MYQNNNSEYSYYYSNNKLFQSYYDLSIADTVITFVLQVVFMAVMLYGLFTEAVTSSHPAVPAVVEVPLSNVNLERSMGQYPHPPLVYYPHLPLAYYPHPQLSQNPPPSQNPQPSPSP